MHDHDLIHPGRRARRPMLSENPGTEGEIRRISPLCPGKQRPLIPEKVPRLVAYQVTARKYRPQTFADLTGQDHIRMTLQNALRRRRVAHAYLFSGPRGVGKTTVARLLAKSVNCEARARAMDEGGQLPDEPCNQCSSCLEIVDDRHPDVMEIDGASNTGVDNVRDLREQVRYAPARGRNKVYIVDEVHMLSKGAFNALLKTLEEPPDNVIFIFATTEPEKIPETIHSRCQSFEFHRLPPSVIVDQLKRVVEDEHVAVEAPALQLLARTAEGSMRDAQSLFDQVVAYAGSREGGASLTEEEVSEVLGLVSGSVIRRVAGMIVEADPEGIVNTVRTIFSEGQDIRQFCISLMNFFRDLLVVESVRDPAGLLEMTEEEARELPGLAKRFGREKLYRCFQKLMDMEQQVRLAPNSQPVLEVALLMMADMRPSSSLQAVMKKLNAVEAAMAAGAVQPLPDRAPEGESRVAHEPPEEPPPSPETRETAPEPFPDTDSAETVREAEPPPFDPDAQQGLWNRLIHEIEALRPSLLRYFDDGRLESVAEGEVTLGLVGYNLNLAKDHRRVIQEAVSRIWGKGTKVTLVPTDQTGQQEGAVESSGASEAEAENGGPPAQPSEGSSDVLKHMSEVLRDADEIFGEDGGDDDPPISRWIANSSELRTPRRPPTNGS